MWGAIIGTLAILGIISATDDSRKPKPPAPPDTCYVSTTEQWVFLKEQRVWVRVAAETDTTCTKNKEKF